MEGVETYGERAGRYRLLDKIGEGGMGVVHLGVDPEGRRVAVKVLRPGVASDQTALRRLAREVDAMRRVHSPHVAEIVDADVTADPPYVVTQFVPGPTLERMIRDDGPVRGAALQRLATGLAGALAAIHSAGIIHRDLKPGNVMFAADGQPVVIDFGIAQGIDATRLTATGLVIGTPGYLGPEIIEGEDALPASDVHAWASTVAYAATGRAPFGGGTFESIFYKIMEGRADLDGVPMPLLPLLRAAMARNPAERPTAHALVDLTRRIDFNSTRVDVAHAYHTKPLAAPGDFKGRLPPAPQQQPPARPPYGATAQHQPTAPPPEGPKPYGVYRLLSLLLLAGALGLAAVTPAIALIVVFFVLLGLRVADRAHRDLLAKRTRRGPRAGDIVAMVVKSPFSAVRAGLTMLLISPLAMLAGAFVLVVALVAQDHMTIARALSAGAAAFIAVQCLGPGSGPPRRELARLWGGIVPRREQALIALGIVGLLVFFLVSFALTQSPDLRPFDFHSFNKGLADLRDSLRDLLGDRY
jgi:Protein kinase domain